MLGLNCFADAIATLFQYVCSSGANRVKDKYIQNPFYFTFMHLAVKTLLPSTLGVI